MTTFLTHYYMGLFPFKVGIRNSQNESVIHDQFNVCHVLSKYSITELYSFFQNYNFHTLNVNIVLHSIALHCTEYQCI